MELVIFYNNVKKVRLLIPSASLWVVCTLGLQGCRPGSAALRGRDHHDSGLDGGRGTKKTFFLKQPGKFHNFLTVLAGNHPKRSEQF